MARPRSIPKYRHHKQSGQAVCTLVDSATGRRKDVLFGKHGSKDSKVEYGRVLQQWEAAGRRLLDNPAGDLSINERGSTSSSITAATTARRPTRSASSRLR